MELYNLKHVSERVNFSQALQLGLGKDRGLFFPSQIPKLDDMDAILALPFVARCKTILGAWLSDELGQNQVDMLVEQAFNFSLPLTRVDDNRACLELFHGPTLAFKDFGARFMAQCISALAEDKRLTILTATSGDTGAAVADAFFGLDKVQVVVLYPKGKISLLQEKMFTTLGENIHTIAVESDFDACQELVKQSFEDNELRQTLGLNSANSINISRLLAQICYYFEAVAQVRQYSDKDIVVSVPSGNFGNLTAGLFAKAMGLPIARFIAATNSNDTVPRYLVNGQWVPHTTVATLSNAMDVSEPSNWPRVEAICAAMGWPLSVISGVMVDEVQTAASLTSLASLGYQSEPHASIAAQGLVTLKEHETGIFLGTAHPAKFKDVVDSILGTDLALPQALRAVEAKTILSRPLAADFGLLKSHLLQKLA
ncbi:L-threonine synthase [Shewanella denitrificans OS217]|uniref:Threonine synthase n=1 Tax=Shewanella denitrificans (strain OS217 / ATCC BAA-1090 / DSM 15013) TaxID=318161 RepID=Q12KK9_SHEDO|nr:threonine synthase [Shewanella denitrificans]ABE56017.1 L-threonine synthase [Shewanella denitrificans OS217]